MKVLQKHADLYNADISKKQKQTPKPKPTPSPKIQKISKGGKTSKKKEDKDVIEIGSDGFDISSEVASKPKPKEDVPVVSPKKETDAKQPKDKKPEDTKPKKETKDDDDDEDEGEAPIGNGGSIPDKYTWTQTLSEVNIVTSLPDNTRAKHLKVTIGKQKLHIQHLDNKICDNEKLVKPIIVDDSFWTIEDGNTLAITLQKSNTMEWWDSVTTEDPKIDTKKVQPENSNLSDLEGETRQTVEKMMHDQRQKALGLPSSDEQRKNEIMERFMKQHPEMDFSKAKIS